MASVINSVSLGHSLSSSTRGVSITPSVNSLLVVIAALRGHTNTGSTCTDSQGGTYHRVGVLGFSNGTDNRTVTVFVRNALTAAALSHSILVNAIDAHDSAVIGVVEVSGMGRVGSAAVRQFCTQTVAASGSAVLGFSLTESPTNLIVASLASQDTATTPVTGFTEHYDTSDGAGLGSTICLETCSGSFDGTGGVDTGWPATKAHITGVFGVELDTTPAVSTNKTSYAGGEGITVSWGGVTDATDKVALALPAADADTMIDWVYTNGTQVAPVSATMFGSHLFSGPALPGQSLVARIVRPLTWTTDATSGKAVPANTTEWTALMTSLGMSTKVPSHLWGCQDAASPLVDTIGGKNLAAWGTLTGVTYQTPVTGWSRTSARIPGAGGGWRDSSATVVDATTQSVAMLVYARVESTSGDRSLFYINDGAASADLIACHVNTGGRVGVSCDAAPTTSIMDPSVAVRPYLLVYNRTEGTCVLYNDAGAIATTYSSAIGAIASIGLARNSTQSSPTAGYLYACAWEGAAAEFTAAQARALIDGLGFPTSGWWTVDAASSKVFPATTSEWNSLLAYYRLHTKFTAPQHHFNCQDTTSPLVNVGSAGAVNLTASGTGYSYGNAVPGYTRTAVQTNQDATGGWATTSGSAPNPSTTSVMGLVINQPANGHTNHREAVRIGAGTGAGFTGFRVTAFATPQFQMFVDNSTFTALPTTGKNTAVHPLLWRHDLAFNRQEIFDDVERATGIYDAITTSATGIHTGLGARMNILGMYVWTGASAERDTADIKLLLQALAWSIPWASPNAVHIRKSGGTDGTYDASAHTAAAYTGTVSVSWRDTQGAGAAYAIGLSTDNPDTNYTGIDRGFVCDATTLWWAENGTLTNLGTYAAGDTLEVRRTTGTNAVTGYKNGALVHTGTALAGTLLADASFRFSGDVAANVLVTQGGVEQTPTWTTSGCTVSS